VEAQRGAAGDLRQGEPRTGGGNQGRAAGGAVSVVSVVSGPPLSLICPSRARDILGTIRERVREWVYRKSRITDHIDQTDRRGQVAFLFPNRRGSKQAAPVARYDGLEPAKAAVTHGRTAGHLSGSNRATRCPTGKETCREGDASRPRRAGGVNLQYEVCHIDVFRFSVENFTM
jgi:hypothetical protein